jgi:3-phenylpropionate/trans-cinnamate dioxygenase ferredoxin reductase component
MHDRTIDEADPLIVIGAGQAASQLATSLRQNGFKPPITIIGDEPHQPYQRPPLSKKYLAGEIELDQLYLKPETFYATAGVRLMPGTRVAGIDRKARVVVTEAGSALRYSTLVIATGSRARALTLPGADLKGVFSLRTVADAQAIRPHLVDGRSLAIIGGGYIGLELAAVAAKRGLHVTVLEQAPRVMARGVGPIVSAFYERLHREEGVAIATSATVAGFEGHGSVAHVVGRDGALATDLVVVGVGAIANVELAREAGLAIEDGIVVDERCRTQDPTIYAIGDCASQVRPRLDRPLRLESVHNALEQARLAAAAIVGRPAPAGQTPWFWSDQYDVKLQMAGLSSGHDEVIVRGDPDCGRSFAVFYLRGGALIAVDAVNRTPEFMMSKQLIAEGSPLDLAKLRDGRVPMKEVRLG